VRKGAIATLPAVPLTVGGEQSAIAVGTRRPPALLGTRCQSYSAGDLIWISPSSLSALVNGSRDQGRTIEPGLRGYSAGARARPPPHPLSWRGSTSSQLLLVDCVFNAQYEKASSGFGWRHYLLSAADRTDVPPAHGWQITCTSVEQTSVRKGAIPKPATFDFSPPIGKTDCCHHSHGGPLAPTRSNPRTIGPNPCTLDRTKKGPGLCRENLKVLRVGTLILTGARPSFSVETPSVWPLHCSGYDEVAVPQQAVCFLVSFRGNEE